MNIVVCVKQVVDTEAEKRLDPTSWRLDRTVENILNPYDEYAVEEAVRLKEAHGGEITVLCMGPEEAAAAVRKALAMGADRAVMVTDPALAGSDTQGTAHALAEALKPLEFDITLFGIMSTDAQTGQVPAAVAALLDLPLLSALNKVEIRDGALSVHRQTDQGYVAYECPLPAVLSVAKGINEPRYPSLKGIMAAKKKPMEVKDAAALSLVPGRIGGSGAKTRVLATSNPQPRAPGVRVEDQGDGAEKILDFLLKEKLV
ncbi:MAG: electron transfer flavoprotein subunit beta/FixA family protein [Thermoleophilia bacterium]|nr:electron transfer flavoprotein subunit beta/FixA family protein [Thermoleophilia bacterium]